MKDYQDLAISGQPNDLRRFFNDLAGRTGGWRRSTKREAELEGDLGVKQVALATPEGSYLKPATLHLASDEAEATYRVVNVVPHEFGKLTVSQYNEIVTAFYETFVKGHTQAYDLLVERTAEDFTINDVLTPENAALLRSFSGAANKSTGASHPLDERRWYQFICASFQAQQVLPNDTLRKLLIEDQGWPEEQAHQLVGEYENMVGLLKYYTENYVA